LEAKWNANTIQLKWYKDDELLTVQTAANQCTYDGTMTLPSTRPSKIGYDFNGWKVKTGDSSSSSGQQMDFSTLTGISPNIIWGHGYANGTDVCYRADIANEDMGNTQCNTTGLSLNEWKIDSNDGTLYGVAKCSGEFSWTAGAGGENATSTTPGVYMSVDNDRTYIYATSAEALDAISGEKYVCWCKVTGFKPTGQSTIYGPSQSLVWRFVGADWSVSECSDMCSTYCGLFSVMDPGVLSVLLTPPPAQ
jgi:hypothetical protein